MFEHFIIMTSSYGKGKRIALHYIYHGGIDNKEIENAIQTLQHIDNVKASFSTHYVCTNLDSWDSVVSYDPFFEDVDVVESLEELVYLIRKDLTLSGLDVAKYILSQHKCKHLKLEKLTYLSYADYLCKFGKRLFDDTIYAFTYGPVVDSVYEKYTRNTDVISLDVDDSIPLSRILLLPDGLEKIKSINDTLAKYSRCTSSDLVNVTHSNNSPWRMKDSNKAYQIIDDEIIKKHHIYENQYFENSFQ